ncbi:glutaredoxin-like protein C5orf63 homolog [Dreissena polymorpha]|uniref:Glutaredoxin-like protein n=1 Tax=Dreissena polymorpha TaxID=45954 RepID=A0A9D4KGL4_DREPO|nr:glutaredoxin-like protein C5orf63 homolog [Dreissena polymorpha]KAH3839148.1 hypothetical protein DPMN_112572 [Dreissena polymorpha]
MDIKTISRLFGTRSILLLQCKANTTAHSATQLGVRVQHITCIGRTIRTTIRCTLLSGSSCAVYRPVNTTQVRGMSTTGSELPRVYLFTKDNCQLCEEAKEALEPIRHLFTLEEVDITLPENKVWWDLYKYDIPVFYMYDEFVCKHRADLDAFRRALEKYKHGYTA